MIILTNLVMLYFSLAMAGLLAIKRDYERFSLWVVCAGMFFIAYSTDMNFSSMEHLTGQTEIMVHFLDLLRP